MEKKNVQSILQDAVEEQIPSSQIDLWNAVQASLVARQPQQGDTMNTVQPRRISRATVVITITLVLLIIAFITPQGRAFAQSIFRFFVPAQSESFPVPESSGEIEVSSPVPTFALPLATVSPSINRSVEETPSLQPASEPNECSTTDDTSKYICQIALAESQVGFDAREFPAIPQGFIFESVESNTPLRSIAINYKVFEGGGYLTLQQGEGDLLRSTSAWGEVPASAIEQVEVNGMYAEFAKGIFAVLPGATSATWVDDAPAIRLRWAEGNRWFSIEKFGGTAPVEYLDKEALINLAASLVDQPDSHTNTSLDSSYRLSIADVEAAAGFDVLEPTILPKGFEFNFAQYDRTYGFVRILYRPAGQNASDASFVIIQTPHNATNESIHCTDCPPGMEEQVQVNGMPAYYIHGALFTGSSDQPLATSVWQPDAPNYSLTWATSNLIITINFGSNEWFGGQISRDDLIRIAESMVSTP